MKPPKHPFPNTNFAAKGLLFAQTAQLLLNESAYESFRLQALDCLARLREIVNIAHEISNQNVSHRNIVDPCQELAATLKFDSTAMRILGSEADFYIEYFFAVDDGKSKKQENIGQSASYIHSLLEPLYKDGLEFDILQSFDDDDFNTRIHGLLSRYLSTVINTGYSKKFVKSKLDDAFFSNPIKRFDKRRISQFFSYFRGEKHKFEVWLPVYGSTEAALQSLGIQAYRPQPIDQIPGPLRAIIQNARHYPQTDSFLHRKGLGLDPQEVDRDARVLPRLLRSVSLIQNRGMNDGVRAYSFVKTKRKEEYSVLETTPNRLHPFGDKIGQIYVRDIERYTKIAISAFDLSSTQRMLSSSENVIQASLSPAPENQLISIWSAIEVLFGDPPNDDSRITHYRNCLAPCICLNYPWRYTNAVYSELSKHHRRLIQDTMDEAMVDHADDQRHRFRMFMFSPNYREKKQEFLRKLAANPLALQMIDNMISSFGSFYCLEKTIKNHEKRVSWQISRIYRARNEFIHGGTSPDYIDALAKNSFEYFRTCMQSIIFRAEKSSVKGSIDVFVQSIQNSCANTFKRISDNVRMEKKGSHPDILPFLLKS